MMNQKEAVYSAVVNVTGFTGEGVCSPTREQRAQINAILFEGFRGGKITLEKEFDDTELKSYVSGLLSNWLRKDKRLNGNVSYVAKNPGSKAGSADPTIKALRALMSTLTSAKDKAEIQDAINARIEELKPKVEVDLSALPEHIKAKFVG